MVFRNWFPRKMKSSPPASNPPAATRGHGFDFLHTPERFQALLENERMRSDRMNSEFALVVFQLPKSELADPAESSFARELQSRLRVTDHAGWMGTDCAKIGVILWDTGINGAHRFLEALQEKCSALRLPDHEIYHYPTDPPYFDDDGRPRDKSQRPVIRNDNLGDPLPQVKPLEVLFLEPLPVWKRTIDVLGAVCGLIVLSPLLVVTALLIKLTSRGPVFFTQLRDGLGGRQFRILKFRTMFIDAEARKAALRRHSEQDGPCFKMTNDPRITPLGRYLRKSCVDELPQLWNVLKGDMTLVGPRPLDSREAREITGWERRRFDVTPGLTCIWQVHGKSRVSFAEWMRMDIRYLKARTFLRDMKLILQTAVSVVLHRASV